MGIEQLKAAVRLRDEEPALVGPVPAVELLDACTALSADTVHLQAFAAADIQDAVGSIAHRIKGPELVWGLIGVPAHQNTLWAFMQRTRDSPPEPEARDCGGN